MKAGVAFPTGLFGVPYGAINRRAAWHRIYQMVRGFNFWVKAQKHDSLQVFLQ